ncbi:MAG: hypothetical protein AAF518_12095 [Spirochaetota bacterium]
MKRIVFLSTIVLLLGSCTKVEESAALLEMLAVSSITTNNEKILSGDASAEEVEQASSSSVPVYQGNDTEEEEDIIYPNDIEGATSSANPKGSEADESCNPDRSDPNIVYVYLAPCEYAPLDRRMYYASHYEKEAKAFEMPKTAQLNVSLLDNNAGWRSEVYLKVDNDTFLLFSDSRQGPLNKVSQYAFLKGSNISFFIVTHTPKGEYTFFAPGDNAKIIYENENSYTIQFEDIPDNVDGLPSPDWDFNDVVLQVNITDSPILDLSGLLDIGIEYLDYHGYNADGLPIYYLTEVMKYNVNIKATSNDTDITGPKHTVYAIHEYYQDYTCDRTWFPANLRPAGEGSVLTVKKGDLLPNQDPPASWTGQTFSADSTLQLKASYTSDLSACPGNDQTHVVVFRENADGQLETMIFDNPETGVFDPPILEQ